MNFKILQKLIIHNKILYHFIDKLKFFIKRILSLINLISFFMNINSLIIKSFIN